MLQTFKARHPRVLLRVSLSSRLVDLVDEGIDVAFRLHVAPLPDAASLKLIRVLRVAAHFYAAPSYLAALGRPFRRVDLSRHPYVCHARAPRKALLGKPGDAEQLLPEPDIVVNSFASVIEIVGRGLGIGLIPEFLAEPHVASGSLERVLASAKSPQGWLSMVWPASRQGQPRVEKFIAVVTELSRPTRGPRST